MRIENAVAMLDFLQRHPNPPRFYPLGSPSAEVIRDLANAGYIRTSPGRLYGQRVLKIQLPLGGRR